MFFRRGETQKILFGISKKILGAHQKTRQILMSYEAVAETYSFISEAKWIKNHNYGQQMVQVLLKQ